MRILGLQEIFQKEGKIIIGVVHLKPLPSSPLWDGDLDNVLRSALRDARALEEGGVDGIIVENYGDIPYPVRVRNPETIAAMTLIVKEIINEVSIPVGINLLRNSAIEATGIAYVTGARFIRVNVFVETVATDSGIIRPIAPELLRYIRRLDADMGIFADIRVKHGKTLGERSLEDTIMDAFERGLASCVILTGERTGQPPRKEDLVRAKELEAGPILIGSGIRLENIELLRYADGAIVGTYFKKYGKTHNPVDKERVKIFMERLEESLKNI